MNRNEIIQKLINPLIKEINPQSVVRKALIGKIFPGDVILISIGKAAWDMAKAAAETVDYKHGFILTKYGHAKGDLEKFQIFEAGHPIPDQKSIEATNKILNSLHNLNKQTTILLLLSGGGSALWEKLPEDISLSELKDINYQLLRCGADIKEINCVRKHLSLVKGGRLAELLFPVKIHSVILSDVIGDRVDSIASAPAVADSSTSEQAENILKKYEIKFSKKALLQIQKETPKHLTKASWEIISSNKMVLEKTAELLISYGYKIKLIAEPMVCDVNKAVERFLEIKKTCKGKTAILGGGEITVQVSGNGKGGRNQHFALLMSQHLKTNETFISFGTDGTDGSTNAAGAVVNSDTKKKVSENDKYLVEYDSYNALTISDDIIVTGATGSNLNDIYILLFEDYI